MSHVPSVDYLDYLCNINENKKHWFVKYLSRRLCQSLHKHQGNWVVDHLISGSVTRICFNSAVMQSNASREHVDLLLKAMKQTWSEWEAVWCVVCFGIRLMLVCSHPSAHKDQPVYVNMTLLVFYYKGPLRNHYWGR